MNPEQSAGEVLRLARALNLTTVVAEWESLLAHTENDAPSYTDFALTLFRTEHEARLKRKRERMLRRSHLGNCEGLETYDFSCRPQLQARVVKELLRGEWARDARPIILVGGPGKGKTRILKILGNACVDLGFTVLYLEHTADMIADLRAAKVDGTYKRTFRKYEKPQILLLDEFGYQDFDSEATDDLFRLISARHGKSATAIAANTGFRSWHRFFPSKAQAVATVDRIVDRATILRFTGKSFRKPKDIHGAELDGEDD